MLLNLCQLEGADAQPLVELLRLVLSDSSPVPPRTYSGLSIFLILQVIEIIRRFLNLVNTSVAER